MLHKSMDNSVYIYIYACVCVYFKMEHTCYIAMLQVLYRFYVWIKYWQLMNIIYIYRYAMACIGMPGRKEACM